MSVNIKGTIYFNKIDCFNCKKEIYPSKLNFSQICSDCGAKYILENIQIDSSNQEINAEFKQDGFNCLESGYIVLDNCTNSCPAPFMFCKEHSNDEATLRAKDNIYARKKNVVLAEEKLAAILKSKKTWAIMQLGGLDNE